MTKTQIDRLGERLKAGNASDDDLRELDIYRASFGSALASVVAKIRTDLGMEPAARIKVSRSIVEKLLRGSTKLSQMQDVAGCRVVVPGTSNQDDAVAVLTKTFDGARIVDRRKRPSHGYRAVHLIAHEGTKVVEIQVRTELQQMWAQLSEKLSDLSDPAIKYGGGPEVFRSLLLRMSSGITELESEEQQIHGLLLQLEGRRQELLRTLARLSDVFEKRG